MTEKFCNFAQFSHLFQPLNFCDYSSSEVSKETHEKTHSTLANFRYQLRQQKTTTKTVFSRLVALCFSRETVPFRTPTLWESLTVCKIIVGGISVLRRRTARKPNGLDNFSFAFFFAFSLQLLLLFIHCTSSLIMMSRRM